MRLLAPVHRLLARRHRAAAEGGNTAEQFNLAVELERAGDDVGAERWYRAAAGADDPEAANNLALLLDRTGRKQEALQLLVGAAQRGELGDQIAAVGWYRTAAGLGDRDAVRELKDRGLT